MLHSSYEIVERDAPIVPELRPVMTLCTAEVAEAPVRNGASVITTRIRPAPHDSS